MRNLNRWYGCRGEQRGEGGDWLDLLARTAARSRVLLPLRFRIRQRLSLRGFVSKSGQPNQGVVEQNIKTSLEAFEDDDHDGRDDHGSI